MRLWLQHDLLGEFQLSDYQGVRTATLDDKTPAVRTSTEARTNADGEDDNTAYHGARAITLTMHLEGGVDGGGPVEDLIDMLAAYTTPNLRPYLYKDAQNGRAVRRIKLRGESLSAPRELPGYAAVQASWSAPSGVWESAVEVTVPIPAGATPEPGLVLPTKLPHTFPESTITGSVGVLNYGNRPASPVMRLYGPCVNPKLVNITTGLQQSLIGLTLAADQYAEVDTVACTIRLNGRPAESLDAYRDWTNTAFWRLAPGLNSIRYTPASYGAPTPSAELVFRETYF